MQTKLTLRLDEQLIDQAKTHAKHSGKSLSQMVADYFSRLTAPQPSADIPPVTRSLKGILKSANVNEKTYQKYLEGKYL